MKKVILLLILFTIFSCSKKKSFKNNIYYDRAKEFLVTQKTDSAFYYFNIAKNEYLKKYDSLGASKSLVNMAIIQTNKGDFFGGIETSLEANKFLKQKQDSIVKSTLAANYNNMAIASHFLKNYSAALDYHFKAVRYSNDNKNKLLYFNNIGDVLITLKRYKSSVKYLEKALLTNDSITYSKALNNLAKAKYLNDKDYDPLPYLYKALDIRKRHYDELGKNSSFETLSEYFLNKNKKLSLYYANEMFRTARIIKSPDDQILALQKIIPLDSKNYINNFQHFNLINDSIQIARGKAKNQFAVIRYDVEVKNNENQKLKTKSFQQNVGIAFLGLLLIGGFFWYKKRKKRILLESENRMQEHQLRTSKKVHDVVANGIYQVMTKIENQKEFDKEQALDELEFVYEKSRDISYDDHEVKEDEKDFGEKISALIASFKNDTVNTYVAGNDDKAWQGLKPSTETEIYQIIREMLVNMKKHSQADRVVFKFERADHEIVIQYSDNGIGMDRNAIFKNGLQNMDSRIEAIGGKIIFDTETEKGLKIKISFPVS